MAKVLHRALNKGSRDLSGYKKSVEGPLFPTLLMR